MLHVCTYACMYVLVRISVLGKIGKITDNLLESSQQDFVSGA